MLRAIFLSFHEFARQVSEFPHSGGIFLLLMTKYQLLDALLHLLFFMMGAGIGSFLNVVIYRVPLGLSVNEPRRSFCPTCKKQIPWHQNIPLVSWLLLRGKCANCKSSISARYIFVELLVGVLFYVVFRTFGGPWEEISLWGPQVLCLWVFVALLVAGTFIDIEHYLLPDQITVTGTIAGVLAATWVPALVKTSGHLWGGLMALAGAALGFFLLWGIVELGKLAFGRKKFTFAAPVKWEVAQPDDSAPPVVRIDGEEHAWEDLFYRPTDRIIMQCKSLQINERALTDVKAELYMEKLRITLADGKSEMMEWEGIMVIHGLTSEVVIPREAMGFGDVMFLMMIGAFIGWQGVLFTVLSASVLGTLLAIVQRVTGRAEWSARIPFGPYLAAGAMIWVFWGVQIVNWYIALTRAGFRHE